jgi:hypothetical protein
MRLISSVTQQASTCLSSILDRSIERVNDQNCLIESGPPCTFQLMFYSPLSPLVSFLCVIAAFVQHCCHICLTECYRCEEKQGLTTKLLPKKPARVLRNSLDKLYDDCCAKNVRDTNIDKDFQQKRKEVGLLWLSF